MNRDENEQRFALTILPLFLLSIAVFDVAPLLRKGGKDVLQLVGVIKILNQSLDVASKSGTLRSFYPLTDKDFLDV
jgi:hypothetical protein